MIYRPTLPSTEYWVSIADWLVYPPKYRFRLPCRLLPRQGIVHGNTRFTSSFRVGKQEPRGADILYAYRYPVTSSANSVFRPPRRKRVQIIRNPNVVKSQSPVTMLQAYLKWLSANSADCSARLSWSKREATPPRWANQVTKITCFRRCR